MHHLNVQHISSSALPGCHVKGGTPLASLSGGQRRTRCSATAGSSWEAQQQLPDEGLAGTAFSACLLTFLLDAFTVAHSLPVASASCMSVWLASAHCFGVLLLLLGTSLASLSENASSSLVLPRGPVHCSGVLLMLLGTALAPTAKHSSMTAWSSPVISPAAAMMLPDHTTPSSGSPAPLSVPFSSSSRPMPA